MTIRKMPEAKTFQRPQKRAPKGECERFLREVVLPFTGNECLIWPYARSRNGYGNMKYGDRNVVVSRLVCEIANGHAPSPEHHAAHSCGRGHEGCVSPRHIAWKDPVENNRDKILHGTHLRGERQNGAKLTVGTVREIRELASDMSQRGIARKFGLTPQHVNDVVLRKSWGWLEGDAR